MTRTISQIDMVQQAKVHIAIPERSLFDKDEKHPTASVVLKLGAGRTLGADQVAGIVHLVASAVEGMKPNNISVIDTRGNLLSEANDSGSPFDARLTATQMDIKQGYEREMQKNIETMLERAVGPNKAMVRVNAKVNFDQKETNSEVYEPVKAGSAQSGAAAATAQPVEGYKGVLLSEQSVEEKYGQNSGPNSGRAPMPLGGIPGKVGGVAGVAANVRPGSAATVTEVNGGYTRQETNNKFEVSKTTEHLVQTPGSIEQISVAVMLDSKVDSGQTPAIQRIVEAAAGIDTKRGDKVIVESMPFDDKAAKDEEKEMASLASQERNLSVGKTAGGVVLLLGFVFFLKKTLKGINLGIPQTVQQAYQPAPVAAGAGGATAAQFSGTAPAGPVMVASGGPQDPQEVAQVVREWLTN